jgi:hypothetical protein
MRPQKYTLLGTPSKEDMVGGWEEVFLPVWGRFTNYGLARKNGRSMGSLLLVRGANRVLQLLGTKDIHHAIIQ